jgi:hypothetical protein
MREAEAIALAERLAATYDTRLGPIGLRRGAGADPNAHHWGLCFDMVDGPPGWGWVFNLNDVGERQIWIAHRWSPGARH